MRFLEYYGDTWRDKIILHRTPTGRLSRARVGSLPAEEQLKYNPYRYKRTGADKEVTKKDYEKIVPVEDIQYLLEFWMAIKDADELGQFEEDKLVLVTDDSSVVREVFDEDYLPVKLKSVPLDAVVKYGIIDEDNNIEWKEFDKELTQREKYDFIKFEDNNIFLLDLFPYVERVDVKLDIEDEQEDINEV